MSKNEIKSSLIYESNCFKKAAYFWGMSRAHFDQITKRIEEAQSASYNTEKARAYDLYKIKDDCKAVAKQYLIKYSCRPNHSGNRPSLNQATNVYVAEWQPFGHLSRSEIVELGGLLANEMKK